MPPPPPKLAPKPGKVQVFRALYPYQAQGDDELSFEEGDLIYISEQNASGWWKATINGKTGLIPGNYVEASAGNTESIDNPLHEAAKRGNIAFMNECLANNVSVNGLDKAGSTPLHWAARGGHEECVALLLKQGKILLDVQNKLGDTPLHLAAYKGHANVVGLLMEKGADRTLKNEAGSTPFELATDPATARLLRARPTSQFVDADYVDADADEHSD
eukprot:m.26114 g.26114  ORF g.26114 m.26114 type:complete len:217 (+) comp11471_c0_seq2:60-710(+)